MEKEITGPVSTGHDVKGPFSIDGVVMSSAEGIQLPGALLFLEELKTSATSDGNGKFHFHDLEPGKYTINASKEGYKSHIVVVDVYEDTEIYVDIHQAE